MRRARKVRKVQSKLVRGLIISTLAVAFTWATVVFAVTVDTSTRTVTSTNLIVQWSPADQEAIASVQWHPGGTPAITPNLTASFNIGGCPPPFAPEYWGNSWAGGSPQTGDEILVGLETVTPPGETPWTPAFGSKGVRIHSQATDCVPPVAPFTAAQVPVRTRYRFYDHGPRANVIRVDRKFEFEEQPFGSAFRPYMARLSPVSTFAQVRYPTTGGTLATVSVFACPAGCIQPDWSPTKGRFAVHSPNIGTGVVVRRAPNGITPQLWVDFDAASLTNASSFFLLPPSDSFTEEVTEKMVLCFYDSTIWPSAKQQALKLPAGCGIDDDDDDDDE